MGDGERDRDRDGRVDDDVQQERCEGRVHGMKVPMEMTHREKELAYLTGWPFVKILPEGGYLSFAPQLYSFAINRSKEGDVYGWSEQWSFEQEALARVSFLLRLHGEQPVGWIRHIYAADVDGERRSITEYAPGYSGESW